MHHVLADRGMKLGGSTALLNRRNGNEVQEEVVTWFKGQTADFYVSGMQQLVQDNKVFGQCR
jgi:hypothetical protein